MTKLIGYLIIMMSGLTISFEIYVLKIIYVMSYGIIPEWKPDSLSYLKDPVIFISIVISSAVMILGIYLVMKKEKEQ